MVTLSDSSDEENKLIIIQELLKYCPDLNIKNKDDESPLMVAMKNSNELISEELLKNGADKNIYDMDKYGNSLLSYLIRNSKLNKIFTELFNSKPKIENLKNKILFDIHTKNTNFNDIIKINKPIFYHFLDGFLNKDGYNKIFININ